MSQIRRPAGQATGRARTGPAAASPGLPTRELEVLDLVSRGRSNAETAAVLSVSLKTV